MRARLSGRRSEDTVSQVIGILNRKRHSFLPINKDARFDEKRSGARTVPLVMSVNISLQAMGRVLCPVQGCFFEIGCDLPEANTGVFIRRRKEN